MRLRPRRGDPSDAGRALVAASIRRTSETAAASNGRSASFRRLVYREGMHWPEPSPGGLATRVKSCHKHIATDDRIFRCCTICCPLHEQYVVLFGIREQNADEQRGAYTAVLALSERQQAFAASARRGASERGLRNATPCTESRVPGLAGRRLMYREPGADDGLPEDRQDRRALMRATSCILQRLRFPAPDAP